MSIQMALRAAYIKGTCQRLSGRGAALGLPRDWTPGWTLPRCWPASATTSALSNTRHQERAIHLTSGRRIHSALASNAEERALPSNAPGLVMASQANYFRVRLLPEQEDGELETWSPSVRHTTLLCKPRAMLSKLQMRVMVGDRVIVTAIDPVNMTGANGKGFVFLRDMCRGGYVGMHLCVLQVQVHPFEPHL